MRSTLVLLLLLAACSSSNSSGSGNPTSSNAPGAQPGQNVGTNTAATPKYRSFVVIGDSISQGRKPKIVGEAPFFYELLLENDDAKYPEWKGKDLKSRFGADITVVNEAVQGAQTTGLAKQLEALPATLPGPVLVTLTIGGNDMQRSIINILNGADQADRDRFATNIQAAYDDLLKPNRFGDGVETHLFQANMYDPSDGAGDYRSCPGVLSLVPVTPTAGFFETWNGLAKTKADEAKVTLLDMHTVFQGHGVLVQDRWYAPDCIHPNALGGHAIRKMFWAGITGETE